MMTALPGSAGLLARAIPVLIRAGLVAGLRPRHLVPLLRAHRATGASLATVTALAAIQSPEAVAVIDECGGVSYGDLDLRTRAIAAGLHAKHGIGAGDTVGILCRNHRGFAEALIAASRLGANVVLLNTEFSAPQLEQVCNDHRFDLLVLDEEFLSLTTEFPEARTVLAWCDSTTRAHSTLDELATGGRALYLTPAKPGRLTILTSGTTGAPKGAPRTPSALALLGPTATILSRSGLRVGDPFLIAPPLFHGFGLVMFALAALLRSPVVLTRKFDAGQTLRLIEDHQVRCAAVVPVMLRRILDHAEARRFPGLRCVLSGGAPLPPVLASRALDDLGDVLYNGYGSSEIGIAAIATPADLHQAPGTVGTPVIGVPVTVLGDHGERVPDGQIGTVHVGGPLVFSGYTGGGSKNSVAGLMNTGDRGHVDARGRLYIDGRADDMIVSGGENVYPQEVENVLAGVPGVDDVAVIGVPDEEFGQRLAAYVVVEDEAAISSDSLKQHVRARLARYKVPREFVFLQQLPRNPAGKLVRRQLPSL